MPIACFAGRSVEVELLFVTKNYLVPKMISFANKATYPFHSIFAAWSSHHGCGCHFLYFKCRVALKIVEFCALLPVVRGRSLHLELKSSLWIPFGSWPSLGGRCAFGQLNVHEHEMCDSNSLKGAVWLLRTFLTP